MNSEHERERDTINISGPFVGVTITRLAPLRQCQYNDNNNIDSLFTRLSPPTSTHSASNVPRIGRAGRGRRCQQ